LPTLPAAQAEIAAAPRPPTSAPVLAPLRQAGSGTYSYWGFDIYQARLWVEPGFDAKAPARQRYALELQYLRGFKGRDIAQRSLAEMRRQGPLSEEQAQRWLQAMQAAFPDVASGDRLLGVHVPGHGAQFYANGRSSGEVADPEFARRFFGIWLSEWTSAPQLREALLGPSVVAQPR